MVGTRSPRASLLTNVLVLLLVTPLVVPGAEAQSVTATVKVFDASGTTLLHEFSAAAPASPFYHFAVATAGYNDPGSGEGQVSLDNLAIDRTDGSQTTYTFSTSPIIEESTTGGLNDALRYDTAGQRLLGIANSGYACSTNYESIDVSGSGSGVTRARFELSRLTGNIGDGSFWNLFVGLVPSNSEAIQDATCDAGSSTGTVDNLVGLLITGDGDGVRRSFHGWVDGSQATSGYTHTVGTTYTVEVSLSGDSPVGDTATRTLLDLDDVTVTPSQPLPPEDVPGQETPDYPGTGVVPTPDYPGTNPVATPDYPGTDPVPTPPVGEDVGTLSVQDNAAGEVCIDFTPEGGSAQNIACVNRSFLGPADGLVPRGDTTVFVADPPDVPGTPPQAVPDVPGTPPQSVPDVPGTPPVEVPDVPPTPTGSLGETPRTSIDVDVFYTYDTARLTKVAGALGDAVQIWSPVSPDPTDAEWLATHGDDVSLCFSFVLYADGVEQGSASECLPFLGQALAAAEATAGTLP